MLLADPIVDSLIREFTGLVNQLVADFEQQPLSDEEATAAVKDLCELSRDTRFQLGPPEYAAAEQVDAMTRCFQESVECILALWSDEPDVPAGVSKHCNSILKRAEKCRERSN